MYKNAGAIVVVWRDHKCRCNVQLFFYNLNPAELMSLLAEKKMFYQDYFIEKMDKFRLIIVVKSVIRTLSFHV